MTGQRSLVRIQSSRHNLLLQMATTLITGATKGIGKALALKFAMEGHDLVLNARTASELEAFCRALKMEFPSQEFYGFAGDIKDLVVCQNFRTFLLENKIKLDVLINNAAIDAKFDKNSISEINNTKFENYPLELFKRSVEVNITGTVLVTQVMTE